MNPPRSPRTPAHVDAAEKQIRQLQQEIDYTVREYPIEVLVQRHITGIETGENELFVPDYQRDMVWDDKRQSRFIESLLIVLPIPYLFVADIANEDPDLAACRAEFSGDRAVPIGRYADGFRQPVAAA